MHHVFSRICHAVVICTSDNRRRRRALVFCFCGNLLGWIGSGYENRVFVGLSLLLGGFWALQSGFIGVNL
jgi:hypothetical protein